MVVPEHIREVSRLLEGVEFRVASFEVSLRDVAPGDFV